MKMNPNNYDQIHSSRNSVYFLKNFAYDNNDLKKINNTRNSTQLNTQWSCPYRSRIYSFLHPSCSEALPQMLPLLRLNGCHRIPCGPPCVSPSPQHVDMLPWKSRVHSLCDTQTCMHAQTHMHHTHARGSNTSSPSIHVSSSVTKPPSAGVVHEIYITLDLLGL